MCSSRRFRYVARRAGAVVVLATLLGGSGVTLGGTSDEVTTYTYDVVGNRTSGLLSRLDNFTSELLPAN